MQAADRGRGRKREREKERERILSRLHTQHRSPRPGDHDLSLNQESGAQPTEPPRCPKLDKNFK